MQPWGVAVTTRTSLWTLAVGQRARLLDFDQEMDPRYRARLIELGFRPGVELVCEQAPSFGAPRVYRVGAASFSLDDRIAERVLVEALADAAPSATGELAPA